MQIDEVEEKAVWEDFLLNQKEKTFLQSWNWGELQKSLGYKIWRLGAFQEKNLISIALVVKFTAKRGTFLLVQHGPIGQLQRELLLEIKKLAQKERASFVRVAPLLEKTKENERLFSSLGFHNSPMHASAYEATWQLDISLTEEELLKNMRKTTRYLVRQAKKNPEIEIVKSDKTEDVKLYDELNQIVAHHQHFVPFSFKFIKGEFEVFLKDQQALLFFGKYQGKVVASALVVFWSGIGFYHHAALDPKYHKIPVSYLLQWSAIQEAKKRGCQLYDFWGYVDPKSKHPWAGPTLFKMGFGGRSRLYIKTKDLPLSLKYWLIFVFEYLRKIKRGL
ncbi:MAG: peptidoglycan bridge formation glycyltransferase FemA/FemB family protein [Candidatus Nealsonbacteria bacterium]